jgi:hypothetical protein
MIPELRRRFNEAYSPEKYRAFLKGMEARTGAPLKFRHSETPCFFPPDLVRQMAAAGRELIVELAGNPSYRTLSDASIPEEFRVPGEEGRPLFVQVDFGIDAAGRPRLVEIQGFPSLYAYQPALAEQYIESYGLSGSLRYLVNPSDAGAYVRLLRQAIVGRHDPENVILLEIDPLHQKTLADFNLTEKLLGVQSVCITKVEKQGSRLYYRRDGRRVPVHRIYNRAIVDEIQRRRITPAFRFTDPLDVEWAGHPNWYFRISKFSIPYLTHWTVPRTWFLDKLKKVPEDLENYVLKPLYSFAGLGVKVGVKPADLEAIPPAERHNYILQERVDFAATIETPHGPTKAEVRVMYIWDGELSAGPLLVRMGRGKMMGVDHNRDLEWVGASAGLYPAI